jgi:hypothetical protein
MVNLRLNGQLELLVSLRYSFESREICRHLLSLKNKMTTATELETVSGCFGITRKVSSVDLVHFATAMGTAQIRKRSIQLQKKKIISAILDV